MEDSLQRERVDKVERLQVPRDLCDLINTESWL